jgi:hypothetical protein
MMIIIDPNKKPESLQKEDILMAYAKLPENAAIAVNQDMMVNEIFNPSKIEHKKIAPYTDAIAINVLGHIRPHIQVEDKAAGYKRDSHLLGENVFLYNHLASDWFIEMFIEKLKFRTYDVTPTVDPDHCDHSPRIIDKILKEKVKKTFVIFTDILWGKGIDGINKVITQIEKNNGVVAVIVSLFNVSGGTKIGNIPIEQFLFHPISTYSLSNPQTPKPDVVITNPFINWEIVQRYAIP